MPQVKEKTKHTHQKETRPFHEEVFPLIESSKMYFLKTLKSYSNVHLLFLSLLTLEFLSFSFSYPFFPTSIFVAISFTLFCLTLFFYLTITFYLKNKKQENFIQILDTFTLQCQEFIPFNWEEIEYHTCLSFGLRKFTEAVEGIEFFQFKNYKFLKKMGIDMHTISAYLFWKDLHRIKELLLQSCVQEHLEMVKISPVNLEVHASLANAYVLLSGLFRSNHKDWQLPKKYQPLFADKFKEVVGFAVEEFKILKEYAPDDPWIHAQLAYSFKDLNLVKEEIKEYETIVKLRPRDLDALCYLGTLYFSQGMNAKGLQVYETLRRSDKNKADLLINYYGENRFQSNTH